MRWERVRVKHKVKEIPDGKKTPGRKGGTAGPGQKWGHTCNTVKSGRFIYVFGGYGKDECQTQDIHVFDCVKQTWSKPIVKGTPPTARDSHTCTAVGNNLYVFGGTDGTSPLGDLHVLDTVSNTWSTPQTQGDAPSAREGHSAAAIGKCIFVFGGCGSHECYFNDVHILDTSTMTWCKAATSGNHPAPRDSHSMSSWNTKLIVLGGEDASNTFLCDIYILDSEVPSLYSMATVALSNSSIRQPILANNETFVWRELRTSGQKIIPRAGHTTVALSRHLFVFGGFTDDRKLFDDLHILNVDTGVWTLAATNGQGPSPRFSLAGDVVDMEKGILMFLGGCNEHLEALDDMYYLYTEMKPEKVEFERKPEKLSLRKELKRKCQGGDLISGPDDLSSPMGVGPVERAFEAKISDVFHFGFTLEATIDGKPLRGLVFSYKPGFAHAAHNYVNRKQAAEDAALAKIREQRRHERRILRQAKAQQKRADAALATANAMEQSATPAAAEAPSEKFQNYIKKMLDTSGGATPAVEGSGLATSAPAENHGIPSAEAQDSQPPPQDMDSPNSPSGINLGIHQLAEEHMTEADYN